MKKILFAFIALGGLAACAPPNAVVSDFNGASVKIQIPLLTGEPDVAKAKADAEAARICSIGGNRKRAEYVSQTTNQNTYISELLYLCVS